MLLSSFIKKQTICYPCRAQLSGTLVSVKKVKKCQRVLFYGKLYDSLVPLKNLWQLADGKNNLFSYKRHSLMNKNEIENLISLKQEGSYWDFKREWYSKDKKADLLHDIILHRLD